jgi:hypothetical protein
MLDKYIDDIHNDNAFLNMAEKDIKKNSGDDMYLHRSELYSRSYNQMNSGIIPNKAAAENIRMNRDGDGRFTNRPNAEGSTINSGANIKKTGGPVSNFKLPNVQ